MGQYWMIAAPQLRQYLPGRGKLGEILFDGTAQGLVEFLAVLVRPEQPTIAKTGVANTDEHQARCSGTQHRNGRTEEAGGKSRNVRQVELTAKSPFSKLSTELHTPIFENFAIEDVINLSLTNRYFWTVGRRHMQAYYLSFLGPWAGKKIVCVGDYVEPGDYPPGLLTRDEEETLGGLEDEEGDPWILYHYCTAPCAYCVKIPSSCSLFRQFLHSEEYRRMAHSDRSQLAGIVWQNTSQFYPRDQPWILRNLTTKEFVRSEAIALKPEYIRGPDISYLGFGEVVLSRIC